MSDKKKLWKTLDYSTLIASGAFLGFVVACIIKFFTIDVTTGLFILALCVCSAIPAIVFYREFSHDFKNKKNT